MTQKILARQLARPTGLFGYVATLNNLPDNRVQPRDARPVVIGDFCSISRGFLL